MKIVSVTQNRSFNTVREKLEFIAKSSKEPALFEPLRCLFVSKGHKNVDITHGNWELGKDLIFQYHDCLFLVLPHDSANHAQSKTMPLHF